jgi:alpha-glucosidase
MQNSRATYEGLLALKPDVRPFVLTRATYAGGQRYAASWTGDNSSTWDHLRNSTPQLVSLGLSGYPLVGADIGGFRGSPSADLLTRWIELGAFNPIYRDHTDKGTADQEPWVHGLKHEAIRKRYIELRYRLLPYIYTLTEEASRTGLPLMRPLFLEFPQLTLPVDHQFFLGPALLVAPQPIATEDAYEIIFPPGDWYDYHTGRRVRGRPLRVTADLEVLPVYVKAGSIFAQQAAVRSTEEVPTGPLEIRVYPPSFDPAAAGSSEHECEGWLYWDDGVSFAYQRGSYLRDRYTCAVKGESVTVKIAPREGTFTPWWKELEVQLHGAPHAPRRTRVNGVNHPSAFDARAGVARVRLADAPAGSEISVEY